MSGGDAPKSFVPNVLPKTDVREQARLQAQIGNMRQQNSQFIVNEVEKKYTVEKKGADESGGAGALDLAAVPAVYFSLCKKSEFVIDHRTSKILIESCEDCVIEINGKILTACVEIWKCKNVHLKLNTKVKTLQADIMSGLKIVYSTVADMQSIVWQDVDNIDICFADNSTPSLVTGHAHMQEVYPDSDMKIDQFIIRFVPELGPGLQPERCVRLKNGFLSTEREAADWDRRNEKARDLFVENFLKEGGIHLNKDKSATKKIPPNSLCACGSKKKYKNCCSNKKAITGLHETQKPKVYVQDKSGVKVETKEKDETAAMSALTVTDNTTTTSSSPASSAASSSTSTSTESKASQPSKKSAKSKGKSAATSVSTQSQNTSTTSLEATSQSSDSSATNRVAPSDTSRAEQVTEGTKDAPKKAAKKLAAAKKPSVSETSENKGDAPAAVQEPKSVSSTSDTAPVATTVDDAPVKIHTEASPAAASDAKAGPKKKKVVKKTTAAAKE